MDLEKILESVKTVRLSGGIFGKTTLLLVVLCISVATVCFKIATWWFGMALMLPLMGIITYALKRCLDFAEKNPYAAIMEGSELLIHERIVHARKNVAVISPTEPILDHESPTPIESEVIAPDPPPSTAIEHSPPPTGKEGA